MNRLSNTLIGDYMTHDERVIFLQQIDNWLRESINDETCLTGYLMCGIPDGSSPEDYEEFAEDPVLIIDTMYEFIRCVMFDQPLQEEN